MPILPASKTKKHASSSGSVWQTDIRDIFFRNKKRKIPTSDLALFCRKASYLLDAGLPLKSCLLILQTQTKGAAIGAALTQIHKHVITGNSLSDALKLEAVFPNFMVSYIAIGEKTALLAKVCEKLANYYEQQDQARKELFTALMYPITVLLMMIAVIVLAMVTVLPGYANIFEASNVSLPTITKMLINASNFIANNIILILLVLIAFIVMFAGFAKSEIGQVAFAHIQLKIPLLRLGVNFHIAQSLSLLLSSEILVSDAIPLCEGLIDNVCVKKDLRNLSQNLHDGMEFSVSLEQIQYINPLLRDLVNVGEKTGELSQAMEKCYSYFGINYRYSISRVNKLVEPIITLTMGVLLALLMLAVVLPTFELATTM